jgi:hypothetical protein
MRRLNELLDSIPRTRLSVHGREVPTFLTCGIVGFYLSVIVLLAGGLVAGRSLLVLAVLAVVSALSFFVYTYVRKWITGRETLVLLEHVWFALACNALALWWMREPLLPYLDIVSVALCPFLAMGRVGCTFVGCCHGHPSSVGITYHEDCVRDGFAKHLVGVRLFPTPAIEAAGLLVIGVTGFIALPFAQPGTVFAWYLLGYSVMRFGLEGLRGDERPHVLGLSQARWMSLMEAAFTLHFTAAPHSAPAVPLYTTLLVTFIAALAFSWVRDPRRRMLARSHVLELRQFVRSEIERLARTSLVPAAPHTTERQVTAVVSLRGTTVPVAAHVSLSRSDQHGDLVSLCELAAHAVPELLPDAAQVTGHQVLHLLVPLPLLDGDIDARVVRDQFDALYGSVVRRLQRAEPPASHDRLPVSKIADWQYFLDALERDAASSPVEVVRSAPSGSVAVGLLVDIAGEGRQMHSYSLHGDPGPLEESTAILLSGLIAQRLRAHRLLRAGFCDAGTFHFWALVDPSARPGSTMHDEPSAVRHRAQEFADRVRSAWAMSRTVSTSDAQIPSPLPEPEEPVPASSLAWYFRQTG